MKLLVVILVSAGVAVLAMLLMDNMGGPSNSHLRTAIAGGLAGLSAAFVGVGKKK